MACTFWIIHNFSFNLKRRGSCFQDRGSDSCSITAPALQTDVRNLLSWNVRSEAWLWCFEMSSAISLQVVLAGRGTDVKPKGEEERFCRERSLAEEMCIDRKQKQKRHKSGFWCATILYKVLKGFSFLCEIPLHATIDNSLFHRLCFALFALTKLF